MQQGQKRVMQISPERETKRKKTMETRKAEEAMMRKCGEILEKLMNSKHGWVFNEPVDVVAFGLKDYYEVVKHPMDLGTVKSKLDKRVYKNPIDFRNDVRLTFNNALVYNGKGEEVHTMATVLLNVFNRLFDPAYEKFEVERLRVSIEHQRYMQSQAALPMTNCKEADKESVAKQKSLVLEAEENPRMKREMSYSEKDRLGMVLQDLAEVYLNEIVDIVVKRNSNITTPDEDGDIELEVEALDSETLWDLRRFVRLKFNANRGFRLRKHVNS
ncbi:hypothetical protein POM88_047667 [Heracleum sosnowskyi]|uniref:Uncharacterized protein n=1 Tax=Heracleum sosnowskyi TaxID=360622 RepID=A0AAD8LZU1_9APIA|nr:hypothetical protein POM88_047664 [Heracleum sosnowskyi]KAK1354411.1 hypothetical protein POM88_047667 [Heracleum sosnowskyi]